MTPLYVTRKSLLTYEYVVVVVVLVVHALDYD